MSGLCLPLLFSSLSYYFIVTLFLVTLATPATLARHPSGCGCGRGA